VTNGNDVLAVLPFILSFRYHLQHHILLLIEFDSFAPDQISSSKLTYNIANVYPSDDRYWPCLPWSIPVTIK
jgi:hypothetical protein